VRENPHHTVTDEEVVRELIRENPWGTLVSHTDAGVVASHYPVLLDDGDQLAIVTHVGRPDEEIHRFGDGELMVIIAGPHGYISPSWYSPEARPVPTWNFSVAHCYGVPQVLEPEENLRVLARLVHHFEQHVERPLELDLEVGARIAIGTVGIRLPISRFICKVKMSQDKDPQSRRQVIDALRRTGPYSNPVLAGQMQRAFQGGG
jgi:transcriptional regulator